MPFSLFFRMYFLLRNYMFGIKLKVFSCSILLFLKHVPASLTFGEIYQNVSFFDFEDV